MRAPSLIAAVALTALAVAACNNPDRAASRICTPFAAANASANPGPAAPGVAQPLPAAADPAAALDDCLHRWGYTLAASSDRAQEVAQAAIAACTPALTRWNQQTLSAPAAGSQGPGPAETAPSLLTGQATTPIVEHYNYAQARALFYVVQGRAGKCAPPPASGAK
ncbi:hypothetical protein LJR225_004088 [Phenylobacterium sp. LjRoot225]|uniref:hypothetical protein n=1 Tax=Phenylobacterium sp. LjRoot225 TaxID=3342285 RepID=UPI003ECE2960